MVLLFLIPEYCVVFAYLILSWQLLSLYFDGHARIFQSMWVGCGIYFIAGCGLLFLLSLTTIVILYLNNLVKAEVFTIQLISLNWLLPTCMFIIIIYFAFKFSGSPIKSLEYSYKIRQVQNAVILWSVARTLRGVAAFYESDLFFDYFMIEEEEKSKSI